HALDAAGKERGRAPSRTTLAKHLRYLHSCLEEAIPRYLAANPVEQLHRSRIPKPASDKWDYFTDDELVRLWASFRRRQDLLGEYLCKIAVVTGMRLGELSALKCGDINLDKHLVHVQRQYTPRIGIVTPKS